MTEPIVKELTVPIPPERAFRLFTEEMSDWWPLDTHSLSAKGGDGTARRVEVPDKIGARVNETRHDGTQAPWGRVTEYECGRAFGMTWHVGRPEEQASHVRVTFEPVQDGTLVRLVHDNWEALGTQASTLQAGYVSGWDIVLGQRFLRAALALKALCH